MITSRWVRSALLAGLVLPALLAGCGKKMHILQYPEFYDPNLKTVAVLPFTNKTPSSRAGQALAERLAEALHANGTYRVIGRPATPATTAPGAEPQALLTGTVHEYASGSDVQGYVYDYYPYHHDVYFYRGGHYHAYRRHGHYWGWGSVRVYLDARNEGHVSVSARLTTMDGQILHAVQNPIRVTIVSAGSPPDMSPRECLDRATDLAVNRLLEQFAVVPRTVKIKDEKAMRIASARMPAGWDYQDRFSPDDQRMFVVLALPPEADRNTFLLEIRRKDGSGVLERREVVWSRERGATGVEFSPARIYAAGGAGRYSVTFYSQGKEVMKESFTIREK